MAMDVTNKSRIDQFIHNHNGNVHISKILIANNGIAAVKFIRSIQDWAYSTFANENTFQFVVMATPEDLKINAEYIRMAHQYIEVPGGSNINNYANVDLIVDIAERTNSHAVWAGWGHASENPKLPEMLSKCSPKIVFLGPPASSMRSLGDKISSTIVAQAANVPTIKWSGSGICDTYKDKHGYTNVSEESCLKACVTHPDKGLQIANDIGYPVMIKASEGGGGKGIRKVEKKENFVSCFMQVSNEVPGSPIFIMKLADNVRHLEVQVLADKYGNAMSIFGRDCSVQRRHQKIIEEAPATIAPRKTFEDMEMAAVRLARLVGYESAGTVEYLYHKDTNKFYFLELNPRLQVEHPTTEMVSGINLPSSQLQIGMGIPLHMIKDIRKFYKLDPEKSSLINFDLDDVHCVNTEQRKPESLGHVIAVRITAENPEAGFKPSSGSMKELTFRSNTNVWGYFSVGTSGALHEFADSQFGHIFSKGETREICINNMVLALKNLSVRSDFRTTDEYIIRLLQTDEFKNNTIHTGWLDNLISSNITAQKPDNSLAITCAALYKAYEEWKLALNQFKNSLKKGQVLHNTLKTQFRVEFIYNQFRYKFLVILCAPNTFNIYLNGTKATAIIKDLSDGGYLVSLDEKSHTLYVAPDVGSFRLTIDSQTCIIEDENDPTQLRSPSPGKLVKIHKKSGEAIKCGEAYADIEVMKMYMPMYSPLDGKINFVKAEGCILGPGEIIAILTPDDLNQIKKVDNFTGTLPVTGAPYLLFNKPEQKLDALKATISYCLEGFEQPDLEIHLDELLQIVRTHKSIVKDIKALNLVYNSKLSCDVINSVNEILDTIDSRSNCSVTTTENSILDIFKDLDLKNVFVSEYLQKLKEIFSCSKNYDKQIRDMFKEFFEHYTNIEKIFDSEKCEQDVILSLRSKFDDDIDKVTNTVISHLKISYKNKVMLSILDRLCLLQKEYGNQICDVSALHQIASLTSRKVIKVALKAREMLISCHYPSFGERFNKMREILVRSVDVKEGEYKKPNTEILQELIYQNYDTNDILQYFIYSENTRLSSAALEVYIKRTYHNYNFVDQTHHNLDGFPATFKWKFPLDHLVENTNLVYHQFKYSSFTDLTKLVQNPPIKKQKFVKGTISLITNIQSFNNHLDYILDFFKPLDNEETPANNVMHIALKEYVPDLTNMIANILKESRLKLEVCGIKRVTFVLFRNDKHPAIFTFRHSQDFNEDKKIRHLEPATAYKLELSRLSNFETTPIFLENKQLHTYYSISKQNSKDCRFFIRTFLRPDKLFAPMDVSEYLITVGDKLLSEILDSLEVLNASYPNTDCNHLFINILSTFSITQDQIAKELSEFIYRHGTRLWRMRITEAEIRFVIKQDEVATPCPIRFFVENISGFVVKTEVYRESINKEGQQILKSIHKSFASRHLQPILAPYQPKEWLQPKRYEANKLNTTYVYDFPELFKSALSTIWKKHSEFNKNVKIPTTLIKYKEIVLDENNQLKELSRHPGNNSCGMVAWIFEIYTPEYPNGRQLIVISNDITYNIGSFGPEEDMLFYKASELARLRGIPRIYLSANSGARIGMSEELKKKFSVKWICEDDQSKGYEYIYLKKEEYNNLDNKNIVNVDEIFDENETRYRINFIVGEKDGIGVECLKGSGMIAGETSKAYKEIFTITLITCRTVGIGAYLARLGQRVIHSESHPIILTGASALNKVLGKEVYTSNLQLGGTQVMYSNGVSHLISTDDFDSVFKLLNWLSYIPKRKNSFYGIPESYTVDKINRDIDIEPSKGQIDPRTWLCGSYNKHEYEPYLSNNKDWFSGFFDKNSFFETMGGWARSVITGRAKLGGFPVGVIAVESRTTEFIVPADPADATSEERLLVEAAQVWYPNSSYKTAQAIKDFNYGEQLPLFIFANWRGFSGGQRDMYNEILKYGSYIVDALCEYKQPIFVYIVPHGELRGGAWVVVDSTINPEMIEMYADKTSRGGVLEPEGMVEIKYRQKQLVETMNRLDDKCKNIIQRIKNNEDVENLKTELTNRHKELSSVYSQIALHFAQLHDKPGRMVSKNVVRKELEWKTSRKYFYYRLKRRLNEEYILKAISDINKDTSKERNIELLKKWFRSENNESIQYENDDQIVADWLQNIRSLEIEEFCKILKSKIIDEMIDRANSDMSSDPNRAVQMCQRLLSSLSAEQRRILLTNIQQNE